MFYTKLIALLGFRRLRYKDVIFETLRSIIAHINFYSETTRNFPNDTHWKNCVLLNSVQEFIEIEPWLLLTFFLYLQSNFYTFYCRILKSTDVSKTSFHK